MNALYIAEYYSFKVCLHLNFLIIQHGHAQIAHYKDNLVGFLSVNMLYSCDAGCPKIQQGLLSFTTALLHAFIQHLAINS